MLLFSQSSLEVDHIQAGDNKFDLLESQKCSEIKIRVFCNVSNINVKSKFAICLLTFARVIAMPR